MPAPGSPALITYLLAAAFILTLIKGDSITVCEDEDLDISCTPGQVLVFQYANYGRTRLSVCSDGGAGQDGPVAVSECVTPGALANLTRRCFHRETCVVPAGEMAGLFGNPCPAENKYLEVEYKCATSNDIKDICTAKQELLGSHGFLMSDNYPDYYSNELQCRLLLQGKEGQKLNIHLIDLELEYDPTRNMCYDLLVLMQDGTRAKTYCSSELMMPNIISYDLVKFINVSFESSGSKSYRGFLLQYDVLGCASVEMPKPPTNGVMEKYYDKPNAPDEVPVIKSIVYKCDEGYEMAPQSTGYVYCRDNVWNGDPGECIRKTTTQSTTTQSTTTSTTTTTPSTTAMKPSVTPAPTPAPLSSTTTTSTTTPRKTTTTITSTATPKVIPGRTSTATPPTVSSTQSTSKSTLRTTGKTRPERTSPTLRTTQKTTTRRPTTPSSSPVWGEDLLPTEDSSTARPAPAGNTEETSGLPKTTVLGIALGLGLLVISLLVGLFAALFIHFRRMRQNKDKRRDGLSSLRPALHAAAPIPNTYLGFGGHKQHELTQSGEMGRSNSSLGETSSLYDPHPDNAPLTSHMASPYDAVIRRPIIVQPKFANHFIPGNTQAYYQFHDPNVDSGVYEIPLSQQLETILEGQENEAFESGSVIPESVTGDPTTTQVADSASNYSSSLGKSSDQSSDSSYLAKPLIAGKSQDPRPSSLTEGENPEAKQTHRKVNYPLFKQDSTGNLDNYLESHRASF